MRSKLTLFLPTGKVGFGTPPKYSNSDVTVVEAAEMTKEENAVNLHSVKALFLLSFTATFSLRQFAHALKPFWSTKKETELWAYFTVLA